MIKPWIIAGAIALSACTSTYHPEYHPVTVTTVHQSTSGAVLTTTPATAPTGITIEQPALADPNAFFAR
jgi:hypothetical protein